MDYDCWNRCGALDGLVPAFLVRARDPRASGDYTRIRNSLAGKHHPPTPPLRRTDDVDRPLPIGRLGEENLSPWCIDDKIDRHALRIESEGSVIVRRGGGD